jgi:hypothetical protein
MKLSPIIIWIVFFAVFAIIKSLAKKAEQSQAKSNTPSNDGNDPFQDLFNQLDNVKTTNSVNSPEHEVNSVEDFFNQLKPKNQSMQRKNPQKPEQPKYKKVKEAAKAAKHNAQVFASADRKNQFKTEEQKSFRDPQDVITATEEEHAFKDKIVGEEGSVDHFDDDAGKKNKYEFSERQNLKQAVVWAEILKPPKALQ